MKYFKTYNNFVNEAKDNLYLQLHKKYAEQIKGLKAKKIKKLTDLVSVQRWSMEDRDDYFDMDPKKRKELSAEYDNERKLFKKYMARDHSVLLPKGTESLRESVNEAKEITKNIKDVEDGDVVVLGRNKHFKVDYIDPWSAGGRILVGKDVKTGKKAKLKIKFLTARGNTGLADDTMLTVLESINEGIKSSIQKLFKSAKKKLGMSKITQPTEFQYQHAKDWTAKEFGKGHSVWSIGVDTIQDRIYLEVGDDNSGESEELWIDLPEKLKESVNEGSLPKKGTMVKLQPSINLISFMDIKDQDLEVIGYKKTGLISGPSEFLIVKDAKGKKHEINPEYIEESVNEAKMPVNKENIEHYIGAYGVDDDPYDVAVEIGGQYGWTQRDIEKAEKLIRKHYIR